jgi:hypothetical protein
MKRSTNFVLDIDRLHKVCLEELSGRGCGNTIKLCYDILGVALSEAYSWSKIKKPIAIKCTIPLKFASEVIGTLEKICIAEDVDFRRKSDFTITIADTAFIFIRDLGTGISYKYILEGSELDPPAITFMNPEFRSRIVEAVGDGFGVSLSTNNN